MRVWPAALGTAAIVFCLGGAIPAHAKDLTFLSTQLRPLEEAQRTRTEILKGAPVPVDFVPEEPPQLVVHVQADMKSGAPTIGLIGALHGELAPLVTGDDLAPLDPMEGALATAGIPAAMVTLAHLGTPHLHIRAVDAGDLHHGGEQEGAAIPARGREARHAHLRAARAMGGERAEGDRAAHARLSRPARPG